MKKTGLFLMMVLFLGAQIAFAGNGDKDNTKEAINWITIEQAEQKMKEKPKLVLVDVYTSWCGWCKVMDKKTYTNPALIKYVNDNFYAVKFDAEQKSAIHFMGKDWHYSNQKRVNDLAVDLLRGRLSYPTTVIMEKNFKSAQPIPGYLEVPQMESILKFFGDNVYLHEKWEDYQKTFKSSWAPETGKTKSTKTAGK